MAFDVRSQLLLSLLDTTGFQSVDDPLMTLDAAQSFGLLDTLAETTTIGHSDLVKSLPPDPG